MILETFGRHQPSTLAHDAAQVPLPRSSLLPGPERRLPALYEHPSGAAGPIECGPPVVAEAQRQTCVGPLDSGLSAQYEDSSGAAAGPIECGPPVVDDAPHRTGVGLVDRGLLAQYNPPIHLKILADFTSRNYHP